MRKVLVEEQPMRKVPVEEWGKDHWSLLAYVEVRCVDNKGTLAKHHMRCNTKTHPGHYAGMTLMPVHNPDGSYMYSTKLGMSVEPEHDDWDCLDDLETGGFITIGGTGLYPIVALTDAGRVMAGKIREWKGRGEGHSFGNFQP